MKNYLFKQLKIKESGEKFIPFKFTRTTVTELDSETNDPYNNTQEVIDLFSITKTVEEEKPILYRMVIEDEDEFLDSFEVLPIDDFSEEFISSLEIVKNRLQNLYNETEALDQVSSCLLKILNQIKKSEHNHVTISSDWGELVELSVKGKDLTDKEFDMINDVISHVIIDNLENTSSDDEIKRYIHDKIHDMIVDRLDPKFVVSKLSIDSPRILDIIKQERENSEEEDI